MPTDEFEDDAILDFVAGIQRGSMKDFRENPQGSYSEKDIPIATYDLSKSGRTLYLSPDDRATHMHIPGTIGSGKTNLLLKMIKEDIKAGHGLVVLDPTGNLYNDIYKWAIAEGYLTEDSDRFICIDPTSDTHSFAYNSLHIHDREKLSSYELDQRVETVVRDTMAGFEAMRDEDYSRTPLLEYWLRATLQTLAYAGLTVPDGEQLLRSDNTGIRQYLGDHLVNRGLAAKWRTLSSYRPREYEDAILGPRNRFDSFNGSGALKRMFGQREKGINFRECADNRRVVLVNLQTSSKHNITADLADVIGRLFLNDIVRSLSERVRVDGKDPCSFYCYVDECHRFLTKDVAKGINELRQFGLRMILAHQNPGQLDELGPRIVSAVQDSALLKAFMKLGSKSAEEYANMAFSGDYDPTLVNTAFDSPSVVGYTRETFEDNSISESHGWSDSHGESSTVGETDTVGASAGVAFGKEHGGFIPDREMKSGGANKSAAKTSSLTTNVTQAASRSSSASKSFRTALVPELQWLPTRSFTVEEQKNRFIQRLRDCSPGEGWLLLPSGTSAFPFRTDLQRTIRMSEELLRERKQEYLEFQSMYRLSDEVIDEIEQRALRIEQLEAQLLSLKHIAPAIEDDGLPD